MSQQPETNYNLRPKKNETFFLINQKRDRVSLQVYNHLSINFIKIGTVVLRLNELSFDVI